MGLPMKKIILVLILLSSYLPVFANEHSERYDRILARLERVKDLEQKSNTRNKKQETREQKTEQQTTEEQDKKLAPNKWELAFEHKKLPSLDGIWIMQKKSVKRATTILTKQVSFIHCNSILPFEERTFEKEVVISPQGADYFVIRGVYPISKDVYTDVSKTKKSEYQSFSFKGVVIPDEITFAYTLKLVNHLENPTFVRQLWLNGKLSFDAVSRNRIAGKGYEIEYTPECHGFVRDEIVFELVRAGSQEELASAK